MSNYLWSVRGVFCEPTTTDLAVKTKKVNGFAALDARLTMVKLKVASFAYIPSGNTPGLQAPEISVKPGDTILTFNGSMSSSQWAKEVYEVDGKSVIVVPYEVICGVIIDEQDQEASPTV